MSSASSWRGAPLVVGVVALLLGTMYLRELLLVPVGKSEFFLLGTILEGQGAWTAAVAHVLYLYLVSYAAFSRLAMTLWLVVAYCAYWIASVWIFSWYHLQQPTGTRAITCGLVTVLLVVAARRVQLRAHEFDR